MDAHSFFVFFSFVLLAVTQQQLVASWRRSVPSRSHRRKWNRYSMHEIRLFRRIGQRSMTPAINWPKLQNEAAMHASSWSRKVSPQRNTIHWAVHRHISGAEASLRWDWAHTSDCNQRWPNRGQRINATTKWTWTWPTWRTIIHRICDAPSRMTSPMAAPVRCHHCPHSNTWMHRVACHRRSETKASGNPIHLIATKCPRHGHTMCPNHAIWIVRSKRYPPKAFCVRAATVLATNDRWLCRRRMQETEADSSVAAAAAVWNRANDTRPSTRIRIYRKRCAAVCIAHPTSINRWAFSQTHISEAAAAAAAAKEAAAVLACGNQSSKPLTQMPAIESWSAICIAASAKVTLRSCSRISANWSMHGWCVPVWPRWFLRNWKMPKVRSKPITIANWMGNRWNVFWSIHVHRTSQQHRPSRRRGGKLSSCVAWWRWSTNCRIISFVSAIYPNRVRWKLTSTLCTAFYLDVTNSHKDRPMTDRVQRTQLSTTHRNQINILFQL